MKIKEMLSLVLALGMCLSLTSCQGASKEEEASVQSVAMLMGVEISGTNQYSGITEPRATVKINKDGNKTVKECFVAPGDQVKKGDKLFSYDTDALELTVTSAELEVEQLRNTITNYETQIKSLEKEKKSAPSSEKLSYTLQIQEAQLSKSETEYNLKQKEAELEKMKDSAGETEVFSEVDGVVQSVQKEDSNDNQYGYGDSSGSDAYITIMETGTYRIKGTASEESIRGLTEGTEMTAYSRQDSSQSWHGVISSVNTGSAESQSNDNGSYYDGSNGEGSSKYAFYVELDNSDGLLIGQHVYLKPGSGEENGNAIRLPSGYLVMDGDSASVWAADSKDKLEKRSVTLGEYNEETDEYVISDGLALTDYIAYPDESLSAGMKVVRYDESSFGGGEEYAEGGEGGEAFQGEGEFVPDGEQGPEEGRFAEGSFAQDEAADAQAAAEAAAAEAADGEPEG